MTKAQLKRLQNLKPGKPLTASDVAAIRAMIAELEQFEGEEAQMNAFVESVVQSG